MNLFNADKNFVWEGELGVGGRKMFFSPLWSGIDSQSSWKNEKHIKQMMRASESLPVSAKNDQKMNNMHFEI